VGRFVWLALIVVVGLGVRVPDPRQVPIVGTLLATREPADLVSTGRTPYFILEPGYSLVLQGGDAQLTVTVLNETKRVGGVEARVVEERETTRGRLVEVSRNYFAINKRTGDVFHFGEDVNAYEDGRIAEHAGAWLSGVNGARFGLMMPGRVMLGVRYYQEIAPRVALDRATIVGTGVTVKTPAGEFTNCLMVEETTPLQRFTTEYKYYAPGVGLVQDGALKLVKVTREGKEFPPCADAVGQGQSSRPASESWCSERASGPAGGHRPS
jgi:hypothetical protein